MEAFDLTDKDVGRRGIAALQRQAEQGPVRLIARGARFRERVELIGCTFAEFDLEGAEVEQGMTLNACTFRDDVGMDRLSGPRLSVIDATIVGSAYLRGAEVSSMILEGITFGDYVSLDEARIGQLSLRNVSFAAEVRLRQLTVAGEARFRGVTFKGVASFQDSSWGALRITGCDFDGPAHTGGMAVAQTLALVGCRMADSRNLEFRSGSLCEIREVVFAQPLNLRVLAPELDASSSSFEQGLDLILAPGALLHLARASLGGPSLITGDVVAGARPRLTSLDGTRLQNLTLRGLDLRDCSFVRAHALDDVVISGQDQLPLAPRFGRWQARREVLPDEYGLRHARELRRRPHGPARWYTGNSTPRNADPATLAETYRALRRGREEARDRPGAADFYYGEMEMRRIAAASATDRIIINLYWLLSGYGIRASRALVAYAVVVALLSVGLWHWGLSKEVPFTDVVPYVLATTTVLAKPAVDLKLDTIGTYLQVVARLAGPALFALMLLALRSRVRR
jgi:uncharacterized protein YjbI with pentapeptide repeats